MMFVKASFLPPPLPQCTNERFMMSIGAMFFSEQSLIYTFNFNHHGVSTSSFGFKFNHHLFCLPHFRTFNGNCIFKIKVCYFRMMHENIQVERQC